MSLGAVITTLPAGSIITKYVHFRLVLVDTLLIEFRLGIPSSMHMSLFLIVISAVLAGVSPNLGLLSVACILFGLSDCIWGVARHSWVTSIVTVESRGRVLSPLGGLGNFSNFVGPIIGGLVSNYWETRYGFFIQVGLTLIVLVIIYFVPRKDPQDSSNERGNEKDVQLVVSESEDNSDEEGPEDEIQYMDTKIDGPSDQHTLQQKVENGIKDLLAGLAEVFFLIVTLIRENAWNLFTVGTYCFFLSIVRSARLLVIPLVALNIGLSKTQVGLVTSIAFGINTLFCALGGYMMDKYGRRLSGILASIIIGFAFIPLPFILNVWGLVLTATLTGIGNSFGSGLVLTMGADIAPSKHRSEFLGIFRLAINLGSVIGPLILGLLMDHVPLLGACGFVAGMGVLGALWMFFMVTETLIRKENIEVVTEAKEREDSEDLELDSDGTDTSADTSEEFQELKDILAPMNQVELQATGIN